MLKTRRDFMYREEQFKPYEKITANIFKNDFCFVNISLIFSENYINRRRLSQTL